MHSAKDFSLFIFFLCFHFEPFSTFIKQHQQQLCRIVELDFMKYYIYYRVSKIKSVKSKGLYLGNEALLTTSW